MSDVDQWTKLDELVAGQLKDWCSSVETKIRCLETLVYSEAKSLFGVVSVVKTIFFLVVRKKS